MTVPERIAPMLATIGEPFDSDDHQFEIKWDGTRCIAHIGQTLRLQNRRDIEMVSRYPELTCLCSLAPGTIVDGEIVVLEDGKPSFRKLQQREHLQSNTKIAMLAERLPATLILFDVLYDAGTNLMNQPLSDRRERLRELVADIASPHVIQTDAIVTHGIDYFKAAEAHALEGIMAKRLASRYQPGTRSPDWVKIKVAQEGDFDVIGYKPSDTGDWVAALALGERRGRKWTFKGNVGTGFTEEQRRELLAFMERADALDDPPERRNDVEWKATGLRCRVRYFEKTFNGRLRAPVFVGFVS